MQRRQRWVSAVAITVGTMTGCGISPEDRQQTVREAFAISKCPSFGCGANSPVIGAFEFHELSLDGVPDAEGFAIQAPAGTAQIVQAGVAYDLQVTGNHIIGVSGKDVLAGQDLIDAQIQIMNGAQPYVLVIRSVRETGYFLGSTKDTVGAYTLEWAAGVIGDSGPTTNVCNNIALLEELIKEQGGGPGEPRGTSYASTELMGLRTYESVVFEGDRIDATRKQMRTKPDDAWFNIGCAGHTLSKLLLTRNTVHTQVAPQPITAAWQQRQATLKMLVADYCGRGTPLTVAGQRLVWQGDLMTYFSPPDTLEARWGADGAQCLETPRMRTPTSSLGAATFPDIDRAIEIACKAAKLPVPDRCPKPDDFTSSFGELRVSANPAP